MERFEKSPRNQEAYEQHKLERKLKGKTTRVLTPLDVARIEAARERRFQKFLFLNPMAEV